MLIRSTDIFDALHAIEETEPDFRRGLSDGLNTWIAKGDGMYTGDKEYYLRVGRSALDCINLALQAGLRSPEKIRNILDFACGYGRVSRWLAAAFPSSALQLVDVDPDAVKAVTELFGVETSIISKDWKNVSHKRFDLIWCGSLFTHLDAYRSRDLLRLFYSRLQPGGILATTIHGPYVANRLADKEKLYGLEADAVKAIIDEYNNNGYGFRPYKGSIDYGISITRSSMFIAYGEEANLQPLLFSQRGWVRHQDFVAFQRG